MLDDASRDVLFGPAPPRKPASEARMRAMARQLAAARDEWDDDARVPRRLVLLGLARRTLPVGDQTTLLEMASKGEGSTCSVTRNYGVSPR